MGKRSFAIVVAVILTAFIGIETAQAEPPSAIRQFIPVTPFWYDDPDTGERLFCVVAPPGGGNCFTVEEVTEAPLLVNVPKGPSI